MNDLPLASGPALRHCHKKKCCGRGEDIEQWNPGTREIIKDCQGCSWINIFKENFVGGMGAPATEIFPNMLNASKLPAVT